MHWFQFPIVLVMKREKKMYSDINNAQKLIEGQNDKKKLSIVFSILSVENNPLKMCRD